MDIQKILEPKAGDRNARVDRSKALLHPARFRRTEGQASLEPTDSIEISGKAQGLDRRVEAMVEKLREMERNTDLDPARLESVREQLAQGHYAKPEILEDTAARILDAL